MRRYGQITSGEAVPLSTVVSTTKAPVTRGLTESMLDALLIPRKTTRTGNERREERHYRLVGTAQIVSAQGEALATVVNVSERGLMVETSLTPMIGERLEICFEGFESVEGRVVWSKSGRIGVDLGAPGIDLVPFN